MQFLTIVYLSLVVVIVEFGNGSEFPNYPSKNRYRTDWRERYDCDVIRQIWQNFLSRSPRSVKPRMIYFVKRSDTQQGRFQNFLFGPNKECVLGLFAETNRVHLLKLLACRKRGVDNKIKIRVAIDRRKMKMEDSARKTNHALYKVVETLCFKSIDIMECLCTRHRSLIGVVLVKCQVSDQPIRTRQSNNWARKVITKWAVVRPDQKICNEMKQNKIKQLVLALEQLTKLKNIPEAILIKFENDKHSTKVYQLTSKNILEKNLTKFENNENNTRRISRNLQSETSIIQPERKIHTVQLNCTRTDHRGKRTDKRRMIRAAWDKKQKNTPQFAEGDLLEPFLPSENSTDEMFAVKWMRLKNMLLHMKTNMVKKQFEYSKIESRVKGLLKQGEKLSQDIEERKKMTDLDAASQLHALEKMELERKAYEKKIEGEVKKRLDIENKLYAEGMPGKLDSIQSALNEEQAKIFGEENLEDYLNVDGSKKDGKEGEKKESVNERLAFEGITDIDADRVRVWEGMLEEDKDLEKVDTILDKILHRHIRGAAVAAPDVTMTTSGEPLRPGEAVKVKVKTLSGVNRSLQRHVSLDMTGTMTGNRFRFKFNKATKAKVKSLSDGVGAMKQIEKYESSDSGGYDNRVVVSIFDCSKSDNLFFGNLLSGNVTPDVKCQDKANDADTTTSKVNVTDKPKSINVTVSKEWRSLPWHAGKTVGKFNDQRNGVSHRSDGKRSDLSIVDVRQRVGASYDGSSSESHQTTAKRIGRSKRDARQIFGTFSHERDGDGPQSDGRPIGRGRSKGDERSEVVYDDDLMEDNGRGGGGGVERRGRTGGGKENRYNNKEGSETSRRKILRGKYLVDRIDEEDKADMRIEDYFDDEVDKLEEEGVHKIPESIQNTQYESKTKDGDKKESEVDEDKLMGGYSPTYAGETNKGTSHDNDSLNDDDNDNDNPANKIVHHVAKTKGVSRNGRGGPGPTQRVHSGVTLVSDGNSHGNRPVHRNGGNDGRGSYRDFMDRMKMMKYKKKVMEDEMAQKRNQGRMNSLTIDKSIDTTRRDLRNFKAYQSNRLMKYYKMEKNLEQLRDDQTFKKLMGELTLDLERVTGALANLKENDHVIDTLQEDAERDFLRIAPREKLKKWEESENREKVKRIKIKLKGSPMNNNTIPVS